MGRPPPPADPAARRRLEILKKPGDETGSVSGTRDSDHKYTNLYIHLESADLPIYFYALNKVIFKPTLLIRASLDQPIQFDIAANVMLRDKLWIGVMLRSGNAVCATTQWIMSNNLRIGFAMDITYNEIFPHQMGTYEFTIGYDIDFFGRSYVRAKYF